MVFHCSNCNIILFFYHVKKLARDLSCFINAYDFYYILLYISIDFLIHGYIVYSI